MNSAEASGALVLLGVTLVTAGVAVSVTGSLPPAATFVCFGLGTSYATVAATAWFGDANDVSSLWLAVLPAALTSAVALVAAQVLGLLGTSNPAVPALVAGAFAAVTLPYALGVATGRDERWVVLLLLIVATSPLAGVVGWAALNIDAEEGGLLLAFGIVGFLALVPPAVPNYLLGRAVCRSVPDADPPDTQFLAAVAVPFILALLSLVAMPWMVLETTFGPVVALLVAGGLFSIGVAFYRVAD